MDYTIPSDNRELQLNGNNYEAYAIIPYQVITGNYNKSLLRFHYAKIIPYQVITGNYNVSEEKSYILFIIPYQVITGNYNMAFE